MNCFFMNYILSFSKKKIILFIKGQFMNSSKNYYELFFSSKIIYELFKKLFFLMNYILSFWKKEYIVKKNIIYELFKKLSYFLNDQSSF